MKLNGRNMVALLLGCLTLLPFCAFSQATFKGKVVEDSGGAPLLGANIRIQNTNEGTATDEQGEFILSTTMTPPFILEVSYIGYEAQTINVSQSQTSIIIRLKESFELGQEVVVAASRMEESILLSPVSIEKLNVTEMKQMSAANFYDGLYALKGVDMVVHGLTFRLPNARGFNGPTSVRMNQLVDGVDNAPPGLNFAAGNIFGLNPLDVESVELLIGASSALYGPGGMNGTLLMTSKNPFEYQGLSGSLQAGVMHVGASYRNAPGLMTDLNLRYAKSINNRAAFKISAGYVRAEDWHAADFRDRTNLNNPNLTRRSNPGYDGVNAYGDEIIVPVNLKDVAPQVAEGVAASQNYQPGTPEYQELYDLVISLLPDQVISRTGYDEKHLVDYGTRNIRINGAFHYKLTDKTEAIIQGGYGNGTSVYTTTNRFSLKNFSIGNVKLEIKSPVFYVRTYAIAEGSGDSYDAGATALRMNEAWKPSENWYPDYIAAFTQQRLIGDDVTNAHRFARLIADNRDEFGNVFNASLPSRPLPGSPEFETLFKQITTTPVNLGGSKVIDKSKLWHSEGMYNFSEAIKFIELQVGGSYRLYMINSEGTIFIDTPGEPIQVSQYGLFAQAGKKILKERVKLVAAARYDKNENFDGHFTPRFSVVYSLDKDPSRNIRASYQTAFRFPTISDQFVNLNTGRYEVVGGLQSVQNLHQFDTSPVYPLSGTNTIVDKPITDKGPFQIPAFGPERVTALEVGYKGLHFGKKVLFDAYWFRNVYNGFLATQVLAQYPNTPQEKRYETTISTDFPVTTNGWAVGADYMLKGFLIRSNVNYNHLKTEEETPAGFQSSFNSPRYRYNVSIGHRKLTKNIGFNINYRWQKKFLWESNFGVGEVPAFGTLDASVSTKLKYMNSSLKIGGSNLLNKYYTTNFGSAQVGGLYYVTWTFDDLLQ
jgi:outer membrane receptor protein involved in Fe transport